PGITGIGYLANIGFNRLPEHEEALRDEGFADYTVHPAGIRESYAPVVFLEPMNETNQRSLGFDMASEPVRSLALNTARDTGEAVLSAPTSLDIEGTGSGEAATFLVYPVYRKGVSPQLETERRAALLGWTYSPWRVTTLVNAIL